MTSKKKTGKKTAARKKTGKKRTKKISGNSDSTLRLYKERLGNILDLTTEFYWEQDEHHRFTLILNPRVEGVDTTVVNIGKTRWELGGIPLADGGKWDKHKAVLKARQPFHDYVYMLDIPHLGRIYASISGKPRFDNAGHFKGYYGITKDITREMRDERLLRLENKVTHMLTETENIPDTLKSAIRAICESEGWEAGNFWRLDEAAALLRFDLGWLGDKGATAEWIFEQAQDVTFTIEQGLPGLVWQSGEPLWVPDVLHDTRIESTEISEKTGWNSVFLMPVTSEGKFIGVLDFYAPKIAEPDERLLQVIRILGAAIGLFYQRATALERLRESEERFYSTVELAAIGIVHVNTEGRFIQVNRQMCELLGYTEQELLHKTVRDISHPDDIHLTDDPIARLRAGKIESFKLEKRYIRKDGTPIWISLSVSGKRAPDGHYLHEISVVEDISARKQAEQAMKDSEARFRSLTELSSDWYWEMDTDYRFVRFEGRDRDFINNLRKDYLGKRGWETEVEMADDENEAVLMNELMDERKSFRDIVGKRILEDGTVRYSSVSGEPLFDENGEFTGYRGLSRDITEQKLAEEKIRYLATHDGMTGLANREMFNELVNLAIESARRYDRKIAVFFLDLDGFKAINDTLGHEFGDRMLIEIADRLRHCVRASDVVARLGGDEFVVLVPEVHDINQLNMIAKNILSMIAKPVEILGRQRSVTASIGISVFPLDAQNLSALMKNSDIAMYRAKEKGKNDFQIYSTTSIPAYSKEEF